MKQRLRCGCAVSSKTMFIDRSMFLLLSVSHYYSFSCILLNLLFLLPPTHYATSCFSSAFWLSTDESSKLFLDNIQAKEGETCYKQWRTVIVSFSVPVLFGQVHVKTGKSNGFPHGKSEDLAATRIQNAFRTFTARKDVHDSKVPERCQDLVQGETATKQVSSFIHSWSRMQQEIRARRLCMVTEYRVKQKKLENQLKLEAKIHELEAEWSGGSETKEEILFKIQQREEAAVRRERAMAYAFSHQWRANSILDLSPASYSLDKENWGWSWKERWIAARPWEIRANTHPTIPKKVQMKQTSKVNKVTYQSGLKVSNLAGHSSLNSKGSSKAKNSAISNC
ncbi:protein IQ-DOMAIN 10-like isoform X1 [Cucumis melo]|uniref:Protein IQ-DOMAIN 10-like isoform X1 n=1 Tax=Cucumis melo TaxID=3656 RepID=A0A1S4DYY8_CUCME|nr:protein IQ-DOMAIN 10-like isoform X1 [Cucumis melo]